MTSSKRNIILFDDDSWTNFLPLTFTRPISELRMGILTIREKWERVLNGRASYITQEYLAEKFPIQIEDHNFIINGSVLPNPKLTALIAQLDHNEALLCDDALIAAHLDKDQFDQLVATNKMDDLVGISIKEEDFDMINFPYDLFSQNAREMESDFQLLTKNRKSETVSASNNIIGDNIFLEKGAKVECATINTNTGPVYIGKNAEIMEGAVIRGGLSLGEDAVVKMGAKIYGATTIGRGSKVGGEVNNCIFQSFSNKGHDGFLGNSVIGEWCNLGADTNSSNLKNNYAEVKLWSYVSESFQRTGMQFCGLIMGDHAKCGINTMFNTGTVVGAFANIFGEGFPRNFVPSFSWGGKQGFKTYQYDKAIEVAEIVMKRRNQVLSDTDKTILKKVFESTSKFRHWE